VVAVPVAVPVDMQESRNNRRRVDFCNPDKLRVVPRVEQYASAPVQDSNNRVERVRLVVVDTWSFPAVLNVDFSLLKPVRQ